MRYHASDNPPFDHTVYVDGSWFLWDGQPATGYTANSTWSRAFYPIVLNNAEFELGQYKNLPDFTPPLSDATSLAKLINAIGKGIGNVAAHETGHQIAFTVPLPGMECGPGESKPCEDVNSVYETGRSGLWFFIDYKPPIKWETTDINALQKYLKCTSNDCK